MFDQCAMNDLEEKTFVCYIHYNECPMKLGIYADYELSEGFLACKSVYAALK